MNDLLPKVAAPQYDAISGTDAIFRLGFRVLAWEAFAGPELSLQADWRAWANQKAPDWTLGKTPPAPVSIMAPILRRRADSADRLGLEVALRLAPAGGVPTVFASRHGQVTRSASMLTAQAAGEPASPMDFSLSVHNATAGQYSIAAGDRHASTSLSSREESFASGLLEAMGMAAEGHPRVMLVVSDPVLPEIYAGPERGEPAGYSLAVLLGSEGGAAFTMTCEEAVAGQDDTLPQGLAFLRLLAGDGETIAWERGGRRWTWTRTAADGGSTASGSETGSGRAAAGGRP